MVYINNVKSSGCYYCNENEVVCIDLHHIDPKTKLFTVNSYSIGMKHTQEEIMKELEKCIPVCANCHRKFHAGLLPKSKSKTRLRLPHSLEVDQLGHQITARLVD